MGKPPVSANERSSPLEMSLSWAVMTKDLHLQIDTGEFWFVERQQKKKKGTVSKHSCTLPKYETHCQLFYPGLCSGGRSLIR